MREGAVSGSLASLLSFAALAWAGRRQAGSATAPINAASQWLWKGEALRQDEPTLRHTLTGYAIHHGAATMWGVLHARFWGTQPENKRPVPALAGAAAATAVAALVDFKLTPERFTPGFQHRVSTGALVGAYACFALGIALGSMAMRERARRRQAQEEFDEAVGQGDGADIL
ncbi:conserved hypothetical protein [Ramlibacter tataouinensis TTB310]|uniref:Candidate membrane protein n=1 Tax=Ramlibacter tataouinensis (strain ATCC BAA-407 / DSM 14655 / LMG 21543 / TTB310) TaxID=365046 RepID=F5Y1L7_RAMTT|nr:conserved hypothetical protein [Ramlibacter tataouinensis TTB310]